MARRLLRQPRRLSGADRQRARAARPVRTARTRRRPLPRLAIPPAAVAAAPRFEPRHRVAQRARVWVRRVVEQAGGALLDDAAAVHDRDPIAQMAITARSWLITTIVSRRTATSSASRFSTWARIDTSSAETGSSATSNSRIGDERTGDRDALALAAGELVRVFAEVAGAESDRSERSRRLVAPDGAVALPP